MKAEDVHQHWKEQAETYGTDLRATTYSSLAKGLEIEALARCIGKLPAGLTVLEAGCGNGINCIELAKRFPHLRFYGFDSVPEMIEAAKKANTSERVRFICADLLEMPSWSTMASVYDVVFTNRCLINLDTVEKQKKAISLLATVVKLRGSLLLLENSKQAYVRQNECRRVLGLEERKPPAFNLFLDEDEILPYIGDIKDIGLLEIQDVGSLHDILLYTLLPAVSKGQEFDWQYDHPLVQIAAMLQKQMPNQFGAFGQNRLYVCRKGA